MSYVAWRIGQSFLVTRKGYVRLPPAQGSTWLKRLLNLTFAKSCPKVSA